MNATLTMSEAEPRARNAIAVARRWIDELIAGSCTERSFVNQVLLLEHEHPDIAWEVLGRLDQLHRRKRIANGVFARVKAHIQQEYLGYGKGAIPPRFQADTFADRAQAPAPISTPEPAFTQLSPGDLLKNRYRITDVLARTEAGGTFDAIDTRRDALGEPARRVAVHVINEQRSRELELVQRVYRLQALAHPSILRMLDFDEERGELFFTTEWLTGVSLAELIRRGNGALSAERARSILGAVANALAHAHSRRVFHGEVSLEHVLITDTGEVRLQGFVVEGRKLDASAAADRFAFAQMVYEVLSRCEAGAQDTLRADRLQQPAGVSAQCWSLLMAALQNTEEMSSAELLNHFAGNELPVHVPAAAPGQTTHPATWHQPTRVGGWKAAASVLVALTALGGYLLLSNGDDGLRAGMASNSHLGGD